MLSLNFEGHRCLSESENRLVLSPAIAHNPNKISESDFTSFAMFVDAADYVQELIINDCNAILINQQSSLIVLFLSRMK
jgi:hypothetical protein